VVVRTSRNQQERETKTRTYLMAYSLATLCIHDGAIPRRYQVLTT